MTEHVPTCLCDRCFSERLGDLAREFGLRAIAATGGEHVPAAARRRRPARRTPNSRQPYAPSPERRARIAADLVDTAEPPRPAAPLPIRGELPAVRVTFTLPRKP